MVFCPVGLVLFAGVFFISYISWARVWLSHQASQGHYCLLEKNDPQFCEADFLKQINTGLPAGRVKIKKFTLEQKFKKTLMDWRWSFLGVHIRHKASMSLFNLMHKARRLNFVKRSDKLIDTSRWVLF